MKEVVINFAQGLDRSVDPRIAPNGTLARVQNLRIDLQGRMALRNGYQSLGVTVHDGGTQLVPFDLHEFNGSLVCLGNNSPANQTGIRAPYVYEPYSPKGNWRTAVVSPAVSAADNTAAFVAMPPGDAPRIIYSDLHSNDGAFPEFALADVAAVGDIVCVVAGQIDGGSQTRVEIIDTATGNVIHEAYVAARAPRVIACGTTFLIFTIASGGTTLQVQAFDTTSSTSLGAATNIIVSGTPDFPLDVMPNEGAATEFFVVYATATGYTWERRLVVSPFTIQSSRAEVVAPGFKPVSICGATGETVNVVSVNATPAAELRTYAVAGGAPTLGPTVLFGGSSPTWVAITRMSSSQVHVCARLTGTPIQSIANICATAGAHAPSTQSNLTSCIFSTKPIMVDSVPFTWAVLGNEVHRPYGLLGLQISGTLGTQLSAVALAGTAKLTGYTTTPGANHVAHIARGTGKKLFVALESQDPRDNRFRMNLLETEVFSGKRRQCATIGKQLFIAGGTLSQFDGLAVAEVGFETAPAVDPAFTAQAGGGALTLLGVYQYVFVFRSIDRNGNVTLSAPSDVVTVTLTGGNQTITFRLSKPFSQRISRIARGSLVFCTLDVFRTEAGGTIPRFVQTVDMQPFSGNIINVSDGIADTVQQVGAKLYTQGEDGAISGRLPLSLASPCRNLAVSKGKLWLAGLERRTEYQLSIENRPGEAQGFVNDDLFFGENDEDVTALAIHTDGRRMIFGRDAVREVEGEGPNAAGIGDLSDPLPVDSPVGCNDWRSVVHCEHGTFFRASDSKIYLIPRGGGAALWASEAITDILEQFPVTTGAVRHEADQLVTFTVQNSAGTDGRILHLDLQTSGFDPKQGWVAKWLVDRCTLFEDVPEIQVLSDTLQQFEGLPNSFTIALPTYNQAGDRFVVLVAGSGTASGNSINSGAVGWTSFANPIAATGFLGALERITTGAAVTLTFGTAQAAAIQVRVLHLRGAHASQPAERVQAVAAGVTSIDPPALTPSWGSAKNLWLAVCCGAGSPAVTPGVPPTNLFSAYPAGFGTAREDRMTGAALLGCTLATCRQSLLAASLDAGPFTTVSSTDFSVAVIAIRPSGTAAGTPIRAPEQFNGRLVVCSSTDVLQNTLGSFADQGNLFITPEVETPTIYGMGPGGAARHRKIAFLGEFRARCVLGCELSYDDGLSYTQLAAFTLNASTGYTAGQTVRIEWVPRRRKVEGVRARFRVTEDAGTGPSEGLVFNQAIFQFEEVIGGARLPSTSRK